MFKTFMFGLISLGFITSPLPSVAEQQTTQNILVFGDSLSAVYGVSAAQGWPMLLQKKLNGYANTGEKLNGFSQTHFSNHYKVINASVSGETTSGGLSRFETTVKKNKPAIVILELGGNDGLRGLPISEMHNNLEKMLQLCQKYQAKALLIGMKIPPNYGAKYTQAFSETYVRLSDKYNTRLVPFLLDKIAAKPALIQEDGIHPNATAQAIILDNVWLQLSPMLKF